MSRPHPPTSESRSAAPHSVEPLSTGSPSTDSQRLSSCRVCPILTPFLYWLGRRIVLPLYFGPIRITGQHNLPTTGPVILAPTHRSRWDAIMICLAAGRHVTGHDIHFMVSANEVRGFQGWFVRRLGGFPIDTRRPGIASLRYGVDLLAQGRTLTIFPEGDIFRDGSLHPLKPGLARLAAYTLRNQPEQEVPDIPIVPISLEYGARGPRFGSAIAIAIGTPISTRNCQHPSPKTTSNRILARLRQGFQKLGAKPMANSLPNLSLPAA